MMHAGRKNGTASVAQDWDGAISKSHPGVPLRFGSIVAGEKCQVITCNIMAQYKQGFVYYAIINHVNTARHMIILHKIVIIVT